MQKVEYILGIDEAGRGPLAGPVAVGVVAVPATFDRSLLKEIRDSKQLTEAKRNLWYTIATKAKVEHLIYSSVSLMSVRTIDTKGIVYAIQSAMNKSLQRIGIDPTCTTVLLDGSLTAPKKYVHQHTIIRGDETEPIISLASVMAKVTRDRYMVHIAKKYPEYGFEIHKGYGTEFHREQIKKHGLSELHRWSFCKGLRD